MPSDLASSTPGSAHLPAGSSRARSLSWWPPVTPGSGFQVGWRVLLPPFLLLQPQDSDWTVPSYEPLCDRVTMNSRRSEPADGRAPRLLQHPGGRGGVLVPGDMVEVWAGRPEVAPAQGMASRGHGRGDGRHR